MAAAIEIGGFVPAVRAAGLIVVSASRPRVVRGFREWSERELVLPNGPFKGQRFRVARQPVAGLWLDALDSGWFRRAFFTGPPQSGKTLIGYVVPLLYALFEEEESAGVLLPDMNMARDKWSIDIRPVILAGPYKSQLPRTGSGSRGGAGVEEVHFENGSVLKFMTGAAGRQGDAKRAGFTARYVVGTEIEKFQASSAGSPESDPLTQAEARHKAYGELGRSIFECTVTTEEGRTWDEICRGSGSNPAQLCPHCGSFVMLGRNNLVGWEDAQTEAEVVRLSRFACPACGALWSEADRREALLGARLVHGVWCDSRKMDEEQRTQGRVFTMAEVESPPPDTFTLGFRYSSADNLFLTAGDIALDEWRASRSANEEDSRRAVMQFTWALPTRSRLVEMADLDKRTLCERQWDWPMGVVPGRTSKLTGFIDLGKRLLDFALIAWLEDGTAGFAVYGEVQVMYKNLGVEAGILQALHDFADMCEEGWKREDGDGVEVPDLVLVDSGHWKDVAYEFCKDRGKMFRPSKGYGLSQDMAARYKVPKSKGKTLVAKGPGYHVSVEPLDKVELVHIDADQWKTWVFDALSKPLGRPGALSLPKVEAPRDHLPFVNQIMSEKPVEEFVLGAGTRIKWVKVGRMNHKLDDAVGASVAGRLVGAPAFGLAGGDVKAAAGEGEKGVAPPLPPPVGGVGRGRGRPFVTRRE